MTKLENYARNVVFYEEKKISFSYTEIFISSELIFFLILKFCKIKRQNDN